MEKIGFKAMEKNKNKNQNDNDRWTTGQLMQKKKKKSIQTLSLYLPQKQTQNGS